MDVSSGEVGEVDLLRDERPVEEGLSEEEKLSEEKGLSEVRRSSPVGLGRVVLVGSSDGFLHPVRINPPQLQRVVHTTRHDLISQQVEVLQQGSKQHFNRLLCGGGAPRVD